VFDAFVFKSCLHFIKELASIKELRREEIAGLCWGLGFLKIIILV